MDRRASWIIAGAIVVAAAIVAVAIVTRGGKDVESPAPALGQEAVLGSLTEAQDRAAQSNLRNALAAAKTFFTDGETYDGWKPETAEPIEPSLLWFENGPAIPGAVTINLATGYRVVMSTLSNSGQVFCIADDAVGPGTVFGRRDGFGAHDASDCSGGW
jgi:hypothetical protein